MFYQINLTSLKSKTKNLVKKFLIPKTIRSLDDVNFSPLFVIGTNRSGTSITSSLFSQHPALEGLFSGNLKPELDTKSKHNIGFCESNHIWSWLVNPNSEHAKGTQDGVLWGHPKNIMALYRDSPDSKKEALLLVNAIQKYRKTNKTPLIKDQLDILRIGLLAKLFPSPKFVLVIRDYPDYIKSCYHKWSGSFIDEAPSIGLHWLTLNNLALYELEKFATGRYAVLEYNKLFEGEELVQATLRELTRNLDLPDHIFNLKPINRQFRYLKNDVMQTPADFELPRKLVRLEKSTYRS